jgi:hypothetical protein
MSYKARGLFSLKHRKKFYFCMGCILLNILSFGLYLIPTILILTDKEEMKRIFEE